MITDTAKKRMLEQLDTSESTDGSGLSRVILLRRSDDGTTEVEYVADGQYGGSKSITWKAISTDTLEQDGSVIFDVEQGKRIVGYVLIFDNGIDMFADSTIKTDEYVFDEDGTFTISNINITLG